jgi:glucokinase
MYLGVDVGGTKTLVAALTGDGVISKIHKFPTPKKYDDFLDQLATTVTALGIDDFRAGGVGIPTNRFDREEAIAQRFGNLGWKNVPVHTDMEKIAHCPIVVENDAKLAGLSEAMLLKNKFSKVLYVTVSTGIGYSLIVDCQIDTAIGDGGGKSILLEHKGKLMSWESFASGKAIFERYGKLARDIDDDATWHRIIFDLGLGLAELIAVTQPEVVVIGGGVGSSFSRYGKLLKEELKKYKTPLVEIPEIVGAERPEEAVIYGCYDLAKQRFGASRAAVR